MREREWPDMNNSSRAQGPLVIERNRAARGKASERPQSRALVSLATTRLFMFKKRILEDDEDGKPRKKQASWIEDDVDDVNKTRE